MQDSLNFPNCIFVLCFWGKFSTDPFARHITVSTQLHRRSSFARVHSEVFGTQIPACLFLKPLFFKVLFCFPVFSEELHFIQDVGDEFSLVVCRVLLFSRDHPVFFSRPTSSHHVPHISSIVPAPLMLPSRAVFWIFFHHSRV